MRVSFLCCLFLSVAFGASPCKRIINVAQMIDQGVESRRNGATNDAIACFEKAIKKDAGKAIGAYTQLAAIFSERGEHENAVQLLQRGIVQAPSNFELHSALANTLHAQGDHESAIAEFRIALRGRPSRADYNNMGLSLASQKRWSEAIEVYTLALKQPGDLQSQGSVLLNLGNARYESGNLDAALKSLSELTRLLPNYALGHYSLARIYHHVRDLGKAIEAYKAAVRIDGKWYNALESLARAEAQAGRHSDAVVTWERIVTVDGRSPRSLVGLADALGDSARYDDAVSMYETAISASVARGEGVHLEAFYSRLHYLIHTCNWDKLEQSAKVIVDVVDGEIRAGAETQMTPIEAMVLLDEDALLRVASNFAFRSKRRMVGQPMTRYLPFNPTKGDRLKIGYLSGGFRNHPDGKNMQGVFRRHDRRKFELFCFSVKQEKSDLQSKIASECEHFSELMTLTHEDAAATINRAGVSILLDVNGFTGEGVREGRNIIFAHEPAPVQINFLAWVGTTGASYIKYIVSDWIASPPEFRGIYSEAMFYLPPSYFVSSLGESATSVQRDLAPKTAAVQRKRIGLPPTAVIYSAFNQLWKIDRSIFTVWIRILERVPDAILWLPIFPDVAVPYLQQHAKNLGMNISRIVFTPLFDANEHIAVKALADIQLDSLLYNGHTSGADVLWAGVPSITVPAVKQSARVGGSLLAGLHFEHTIARNLQDYEDLAVALGNAVRKHRRNLPLRTSFAKQLVTSGGGLFDVSTWVGRMENNLRRAWELHQINPLQRFHILPPA